MSTGRTERRLAAILAADVVGYSRLMGEDEASTLAALKAAGTDGSAWRGASLRSRLLKVELLVLVTFTFVSDRFLPVPKLFSDAV